MSQTNGADVAIAFDMSSLGPSTTFLAGVESTQISLSALLFDDIEITCDGILGSGTTAPVVGQSIIVYAWGSDVSLGATPIDGLDGVAGAVTLTHAQVLNSLKPIGHMTATVATLGLKYHFQPTCLAQFFGGALPKFFGLYGTHNHAAALAAAQANLFSYHGINFTSP